MTTTDQDHPGGGHGGGRDVQLLHDVLGGGPGEAQE